ncbi:hypothetical protein FRB95_012949 [Tulasnella sp. JGI-2019a]|nr:hypothetical protein FRB95_012949 [Tulasnella sp. JGI-2019a]
MQKQIDGGDEQMADRLHIIFSANSFNENNAALDTLSWLLDNVHVPSFSLPVFLTISDIKSSHAIMSTLDRLSSVITALDLSFDDTSVSEAILSYLAEPFEVVAGGTTMLRWPLPNLTDLFVEWCNGLESEVGMSCVQRRAGRGVSSKLGRQYREELPAKLSKLRIPNAPMSPSLIGCGGLKPEPKDETYGHFFGYGDDDHYYNDLENSDIPEVSN